LPPGEGAQALEAFEQAEAVSEQLSAFDQQPVQRHQGAGVIPLGLDVALARIDRWKPGLAGCEAARRGGVPLHRMTHGVAPGAVERRVGTWAVREPDLVALIDE